MIPVVFEGCSGWLHPASGNRGMVLCNPFGYDAMCAHKGLRTLAERLAEQGVAALRFDYPGSGDASGSEADPDLFETWIDSIRAAVMYLKATTGVTSVGLCGLRLGGTLAMLAAQRLGDIDELILLAPALSGKNYLRELRMHYQSWLNTPTAIDTRRSPDDGDFCEAYGYRLYRDAMARLGEFDMLRDTSRPASRVLILDSLDPGRVTSLARHYARHDVDVSTQSFDEYDKFVQGVASQTPHQAFTAVLDWLAPVADTVAPATWAMPYKSSDPTGPSLQCDGASETPVIFDGGRLFGMFCRPAGPSPASSQGSPVVLIVNTGEHHHVGDGRLSVILARRLARRGISSLRMDLGGLGDSVTVADTVSLNQLYSAAACQDAIRGIDWLAGAGHERVVMFGVCAGAYVSLHAALLHKNVVGCVPINLQKFIWTDLSEDHQPPAIDATRVYLQAMLRFSKWKRLLLGRTHGWAIMRTVAQRLLKNGLGRVAQLAEKVIGLRSSYSAVRDMIRELDRRGVQTRLVFGAFDVGLDELKIYFGAHGRRLRRTTSVRAAMLEQVDHALFSYWAREQVMGYFEAYLQDNFGLAAPANAVRVPEPAKPELMPAAPVELA